MYLEMHKKKNGQGRMVKGDDSSLLLHSYETPSGVLHPGLGPPAQERHGSIKLGPEEGHKNGQRPGTPLLQRMSERTWVV